MIAPTRLRRAFERPFTAALLARFRGASAIEAAALRPVARLAVLLGGLARFVPFRLPDDPGPPMRGRGAAVARKAAARTHAPTDESSRPEPKRARGQPDLVSTKPPGSTLVPWQTGRRIATGKQVEDSRAGGGLVAEQELEGAGPPGQPSMLRGAQTSPGELPEAAPASEPGEPGECGPTQRLGEAGVSGSELRPRRPLETTGRAGRLPPPLVRENQGEHEDDSAPGAGELTASAGGGGTPPPQLQRSPTAAGPRAGPTDDAPFPPRARRLRQQADRLRATLVERIMEGRLAAGRLLHGLLETGWLAYVRRWDAMPLAGDEWPSSPVAAPRPSRPPERSSEGAHGPPSMVGPAGEGTRRDAIRRWLHGGPTSTESVAAFLGVAPAEVPVPPERPELLSATSWLGAGPADALPGADWRAAPADLIPGLAVGGAKVLGSPAAPAQADSASQAGDLGKVPRPERDADASGSPVWPFTELVLGATPGHAPAFPDDAPLAPPADWAVLWRARLAARRKAEWARAIGRRGRGTRERLRGR
jgi:hypothetical protein